MFHLNKHISYIPLVKRWNRVQHSGSQNMNKICKRFGFPN